MSFFFWNFDKCLGAYRMFDVVNILDDLKISQSNGLATFLSELGAPGWFVEAYGAPYAGARKGS